MRAFAWMTAALFVGACGLGPFDDAPGGASELPTRGAGPYRLLSADPDTPVDEPYLVVENLVSLTDPTVRELADGGFEIYYGRLDRDGRSEIWRQRLESLEERPSTGPEMILAPTLDWEGEVVGEPALVEDTDGTLYLYYRGGSDEPGIARAVSRNGGESFEREDGDEPLVEGLVEPGLARLDDQWVLVAADPEGHSLRWLDSLDGLTFDGERVLLEPRFGDPVAFDRDRVGDPALHLTRSDQGEVHLGLFYTGVVLDQDAELPGIGYLGSFDGLRWQRGLSGLPVLEDLQGASAAAPVIRQTQAFLFVHQLRAGRGRIAVGTSP